MLKTAIIALAFVLAFVWVSGVSAEMKEGLWEMTMKAEMKGMPQNARPMTIKQCLSKKDMVPKPQQQPNQDCKITNQKVSGDTVTYAMACKNTDGSTVETSGKMIYKGDSYEGSSTTTIKGAGSDNMQINGKLSGKYLGPCPK